MIGDFLIDLPFLAVDCSMNADAQGRIIGYVTSGKEGSCWIVAENADAFLQRFETEDTSAFYGK